MKHKLNGHGLRRVRVRLIPDRLKARRRTTADGPLRKGVFLIPATITSIGLLAGFSSVVAAINSRFDLAAIMIMVAFVCDGLDGRVARMSRSSSQFGIEYDSLADVVAFGVAPAALVYTWALHSLGTWGIMVCALFVVAAALRLARFNVQSTAVGMDKHRFVGLPAPGGAIMVATTVLAYGYLEINQPLALSIFATPLTLALAGLMISRVPYPSFKWVELRRRAPIWLLFAMLLVATLIFALPQLTAFLLATAYVLSGPGLMAAGERPAPKHSLQRAASSERHEREANSRGEAKPPSERGPLS